uniref:Protease inhibitor n=1 Tax=Triatoma infestans TaxID=30076 RepID=A2CKF3_TRIIF|nr:pacifastin-related serine protease inhibitor precursor [Triatoma infestans]
MKTSAVFLFLVATMAIGTTALYCEPNTRFKQECNWCTCSANGEYATCTLLYCGPRRARAVSSGIYCGFGGTVPAGDGCNFCFCTPLGTIGTCTMRRCDSLS